MLYIFFKKDIPLSVFVENLILRIASSRTPEIAMLLLMLFFRNYFWENYCIEHIRNDVLFIKYFIVVSIYSILIFLENKKQCCIFLRIQVHLY